MVKDLEPSFALAALNSGLRDNSAFTFSLMKKLVLSMADLLRRAKKYVNADEQRTNWPDHQKRKGGQELTEDDLRHKLSKREDQPKGGSLIPNYKTFIPLLESWTIIFSVEKEQVSIQWPTPLRSPANKRDINNYCRYH
ncbi:hypothetical protein CFOL_v3_35123 [Cephalotus follicularis]|uniref:Uncharacterized protein n=1 Tax=Cephalotus follicularis TaxID=3775 RepID=A0A1Q3DHF9_CEPFO|nr:hypothetical protein CFOL_v3_32289 [Cephalotus follicularis]GAV91733.1 hypothetical protein CFOL_v3_35123 [Cephalotus follicularis]